MVTRDELSEKTQQEVQNLLQQEIEVYKIKVDEISDEQELLDMEKALMADHDAFQARLKETVYTLGNSATYEDEVYKKSNIVDNIVYFLNKNEVEWSYTLGLYQLVKLWKSNTDTITYEAYDSTLRILNQTKYKGFKEWTDILVINEFLSSCHAEYVRDTSYLIYLAQLHNTLIDRLKMVSPVVIPDDADGEDAPVEQA